MNKDVLIIGHVAHGRTCLTNAIEASLKNHDCIMVTPKEVPKPVGFEPEPILITNAYEGMDKITDGTGFVGRKERRKQERELKKRHK